MIPDWRLPPGVPRGVWDYAQSKLIAEDYDDYHAENSLFEFEERVLAEEFSDPDPDSPGVIADLGCGSGRALLPLCRRGWRGLAVDLSAPMLDVVRERAAIDGLDVRCVRSNLVELTPDVVSDGEADHAMCLFSTLGMIRGRANRRAALGHMHRLLQPGGRLVLHVHNFWFNLRDPGGPGWALKSLARGAFSRLTSEARGRMVCEVGDKVYPYRGVPNFFLHVFREGELRRDLRAANLRVRRWVPLDLGRRHALRRRWLLPSLRANGWIVVCDRPGEAGVAPRR